MMFFTCNNENPPIRMVLDNLLCTAPMYTD